jgi:hypothetical protein
LFIERRQSLALRGISQQLARAALLSAESIERGVDPCRNIVDFNLGSGGDIHRVVLLAVEGVADNLWPWPGSLICPIQVQPPHTGQPVEVASDRSAGSSKSGSQVCWQAVQTTTTDGTRASP